jgi:hypothetical protein
MDLSMSTTAVNPKPESQQLSAIGLKTFFNIASAWKLTNDQEMILLGSPSRSNFYNWKRNPSAAKLNRDTLERISYILGIYKALQILLPDPKAADEWISKPNAEAIFGGESALARMLSGNVSDLFVVRQYLDAIRRMNMMNDPMVHSLEARIVQEITHYKSLILLQSASNSAFTACLKSSREGRLFSSEKISFNSKLLVSIIATAYSKKLLSPSGGLSPCPAHAAMVRDLMDFVVIHT